MAHRRPRALLALLATLLLAQLALFGAAAPARAADKLTSHASSVTVGQDGSLQVRSVLTFDGAPPNSIEQAFALREEIVNQREYVYRVRSSPSPRVARTRSRSATGSPAPV